MARRVGNRQVTPQVTSLDLEIAEDHGECPICFEPLCLGGACVLTDGEVVETGSSIFSANPFFCFEPQEAPKRTCRHFICQQCAPTLQRKACPVCRQEFSATLNVPDPMENPAEWFRIVDFDQNGTIDIFELIDALKGMFSVHPGALEKAIKRQWDTWDADRNGTLDISEFLDLLLPFLNATLGNLRARYNEPPPDIRIGPMEWFKFWDEDESGSLERPEVVRALMKTFPNLSGLDDDWLTQSFGATWPIFDPDNDGSITEEEFTMPDGLLDTLLANFEF